MDLSLLTPKTRETLLKRLEGPVVKDPAFFTPSEFASLKALCAIAVPQTGQDWQVDLAGMIDSRLANGDGKGWRYDVLPPDEVMYREALKAIDQLAGQPFNTLNESQQRDLFPAIARIESPRWMSFFWEEFLVEVTEAFYSHPLTQISIGSFGMMDSRS